MRRLFPFFQNISLEAYHETSYSLCPGEGVYETAVYETRAGVYETAVYETTGGIVFTRQLFTKRPPVYETPAVYETASH